MTASIIDGRGPKVAAAGERRRLGLGLTLTAGLLKPAAEAASWARTAAQAQVPAWCLRAPGCAGSPAHAPPPSGRLLGHALAAGWAASKATGWAVHSDGPVCPVLGLENFISLLFSF
jgi:hypothetical protein